MKKTVNVICIKWGTRYSAEYVNKLYSMIKRNTSYDIKFYCFTENSQDLNKDIIVKPINDVDTSEKYKYYYRKEAGLSDDNLGGLKGERVFFFDLDVVIVSDLDEFFEYPKDNKFYIINDWNTKGDHVGQASCYSWVVGTLGHVQEYYEKHPKEVLDHFGTSAQEYLSSKVIEKYGSLNFWPENWFCSFKLHCIPRFWLLRHFLVPQMPKDKPGLKVIVFHGVPDPDEAIKGIWPIKKGQGWKRLYKVCKPTKWIENYWY